MWCVCVFRLSSMCHSYTARWKALQYICLSLSHTYWLTVTEYELFACIYRVQVGELHCLSCNVVRYYDDYMYPTRSTPCDRKQSANNAHTNIVYIEHIKAACAREYYKVSYTRRIYSHMRMYWALRYRVTHFTLFASLYRLRYLNNKYLISYYASSSAIISKSLLSVGL